MICVTYIKVRKTDELRNLKQFRTILKKIIRNKVIYSNLY